MRRLRRVRRMLAYSLLVIAAISIVLPAGHVRAASDGELTNRGLYITPIRQYISQEAGISSQASITVGNFTDKPMRIDFSVKQFSVTDYNYEYRFSEATDTSIRFETTAINLQPGDTKVIPYRIELPAESRPGGRYFTLFATARGEDGTAPQQVQATSVVYLTVKGPLVHKSGLADSRIDHFVFESHVPFSLDIANQGNVHYFAFLHATIRGPFGGSQSANETHLLMPGTVRRFESSVKTPFWPGLYQVTYGYRTEQQEPVTRVSRILYVPPWSLAAAVLLSWGVWLAVHRRRSRRMDAKTEA